jgi:hypothetical protein
LDLKQLRNTQLLQLFGVGGELQFGAVFRHLGLLEHLESIFVSLRVEQVNSFEEE